MFSVLKIRRIYTAEKILQIGSAGSPSMEEKESVAQAGLENISVV